MKYLDLTELAKAIAIKTGCSPENAVRFLDVQDQYFDQTGVNTDPEKDPYSINAMVVVDDAKMMKYIIGNTGMSESFARRLADAERAYMEEHGYISENGTMEPFLKGRSAEKK